MFTSVRWSLANMYGHNGQAGLMSWLEGAESCYFFRGPPEPATEGRPKLFMGGVVPQHLVSVLSAVIDYAQWC